MANEFSAHFGTLTVRYISEQEPLAPGKHFLPFLTDATPTLTVRIFRPERLSTPQGTLLWETPTERVYRDGKHETHVYSVPPPAALDYISVSGDADKGVLTTELLRQIELPAQSILLSNLEMERLLHRHGMTVLHASWVSYGTQALLFSGSSGVGKSTQAELWHQYRGARIINGDKTGIAFPNGQPTAVGMPFSGSSTYCENATAPIRAIVMLSQAPDDTIRRLSQREAARLLAGQMPCQRWCAEDVSAILEYAGRLAMQVPVYHLACTKKESAVALLAQTLAEEDDHGAQTGSISAR